MKQLAKALLIICFTSIHFSFAPKQKNKPIEPNPTFTIVNRSETMPVWVYGKSNSQYLILAVHGGPGSDVLDFRNYQGGIGFKKIEEKYMVAYWQQRASGQSIGENEKSYFTIDQYVEDCDKVIDQLKILYPEKKIIILGHSWGGMLTSNYLKDAKRREKVVAWIDAAGLHNGTTFLKSCIEDLNAEADRRITNGENIEYWQKVKKIIKKSPKKANREAYLATLEIPEVTIKVKNSDFVVNYRGIISNLKLFKEIVLKNMTPELKNYTLPTLLIWGKFDYAVSKQQRDEVLAKSGSKSLKSVELNASGHYMMFHQPEAFADAIIEFIAGL